MGHTAKAPVGPALLQATHQLQGRLGARETETALQTSSMCSKRGHVFCYSLVEEMETRCGRRGLQVSRPRLHDRMQLLTLAADCRPHGAAGTAAQHQETHGQQACHRLRWKRVPESSSARAPHAQACVPEGRPQRGCQRVGTHPHLFRWTFPYKLPNPRNSAWAPRQLLTTLTYFSGGPWYSWGPLCREPHRENLLSSHHYPSRQREWAKHRAL